MKALSDRLIQKINAKVEHVVRNGDPNGYPGCVNLSFAYVEGESLLMALKVLSYPSIPFTLPNQLICHLFTLLPNF